jgi:DNA ligase 1
MSILNRFRPFKPMLAIDCSDMAQLKFPCIASPKIDGIRCVLLDRPDGPNALCLPSTRSLKPIPNLYIRERLGKLPQGLDGEIITYTDGRMDNFCDVQSRVMSGEGEPDFKFHVFDHFRTPDVPFTERLTELELILMGDRLLNWVVIVPQVTAMGVEPLSSYKSHWVDEGYEGTITRDPRGHYKYGRSTWAQQLMVKHKDFVDDEAVVTGMEPLWHNNNEAQVNALGYKERSSHQANLRQSTKLGALICNWRGRELKIGSGFTDDQRFNLWLAEAAIIGQVVKFKYQPHGMKNVPRTPIFLGFRGKADL